MTLRSGDRMPAVGLGTWKISKESTADVVLEAIRIGYRHLDCACDYGNEQHVGEGIRRAVAEGVIAGREDLWVTSKLWNTDHAPDRVEAALKKSLKLLRLDYLDLYLMHWPVTGNKGSDVVSPSILDTWKAMEDLVERGFVKAIGVSNFSEKKIRDLLGHADVPHQRVPGGVSPVLAPARPHPLLPSKRHPLHRVLPARFAGQRGDVQARDARADEGSGHCRRVRSHGPPRRPGPSQVGAAAQADVQRAAQVVEPVADPG